MGFQWRTPPSTAVLLDPSRQIQSPAAVGLARPLGLQRMPFAMRNEWPPGQKPRSSLSRLKNSSEPTKPTKKAQGERMTGGGRDPWEALRDVNGVFCAARTAAGPLRAMRKVKAAARHGLRHCLRYPAGPASMGRSLGPIARYQQHGAPGRNSLSCEACRVDPMAALAPNSEFRQ